MKKNTLKLILIAVILMTGIIGWQNGVKRIIGLPWLPTTSQENLQLNETYLLAMDDYITTSGNPIDSIIVIKNNEVKFEKYYNEFYTETDMHHLFSVTKSFTSALIGIAIDEGFVQSINETIEELFPSYTFTNMSSWKSQITLEHLLTMTSGLVWDEDTYPTSDPRNDWGNLERSSEPLMYVLGKGMEAEPGTYFNYNSGASHVLSYVIYETTGMTAKAFAEQYLFGPLNITNSRWNTDRNGINFGGTQLYLRPSDMAKLGYLYLNNGSSNGEQLVSSDWVEITTKTYTSREGYFDGRAYGYHWWTADEYQAYYASGSQGQSIFIIPTYELVCVFTGSFVDYQPQYKVPEQIMVEYIVPAVDQWQGGHVSSDDQSSQQLNYAPISILVVHFVLFLFHRRRKRC